MDTVEVKICRKCKFEKTKHQFYIYKRNKDGLSSYCKECCKQKWAKYRQDVYEPKRKLEVEKRKKDREEKKFLEKDQREAKRKEDKRKRQAKYRENNPDAYRNWVENNRAKYNELKRLRKHGVVQATPSWANKDRINCMYSLASMLNKYGVEKWSVDHIIPLKGKNVCGLHVYENLRVIPMRDNSRKSNKFEC